MSPLRDRKPAELVSSSRLSPGVGAYRLRVGGVEPFVWAPGQYVELFVPDSPDEALPYSVASAPDPAHPNEFDLAVGQGTTGDPLLDLPLGAPLAVAGPYGQLLWPPSGGSALLIGVGTGVAPLRALVQASLAGGGALDMVLLCGYRTLEGALWHGEFSEWQRRRPGFEYVVTLTKPPSDFSGLSGRVQEHALELSARLRDPTVFLCGKKSMVEECARLLSEQAAVPASKIFAEGY